MASGAVGACEPQPLSQHLERLGVACGAQVQVTAEHERDPHPTRRARAGGRSPPRWRRGRAAPPRRAGSRRTSWPSGSSRCAQCMRRCSGRVGECQAARVPPPAPGARTRIWLEPPSDDASRSGFQSASRRWSGGHQLREVLYERAVRSGAGAERAKPALRRLPAGARRPIGARRARWRTRRKARDLLVKESPTLGRPEQPGAPREQGRIRGEVPAVVEVPAQDTHWHGTS